MYRSETIKHVKTVEPGHEVARRKSGGYKFIDGLQNVELGFFVMVD
jgi:hypothetical protein